MTDYLLANGDSEMHLRKRFVTNTNALDSDSKEHGDTVPELYTALKGVTSDPIPKELHSAPVTNESNGESQSSEEAEVESNVEESPEEEINNNNKPSVSAHEPEITPEISHEVSTEGILKKGWDKLKCAFDIDAAPGRTAGFNRIDPGHAKRLHDEMMFVGDSGTSSSESGQEIRKTCSEYKKNRRRVNYTEAVRRYRRRRERAAIIRKQREEILTIGKKKFEVEKIMLFFCAIAIVFGYPLCYYLQIYNQK